MATAWQSPSIIGRVVVMAPGQPGILSKVVLQAICELVPHAETHTISGATYYTILFNPRSMAQVAELIAAFGKRCLRVFDGIAKQK